MLIAMLDLIGVDQSKLRFVRGTDFQLSPEYTLDMYKMSALLTTSHTEKVFFTTFLNFRLVPKLSNKLKTPS